MSKAPKPDSIPSADIATHTGLTERDKEVLARLLRKRPEPQKAAPKPVSTKGQAQRLRREKERQEPARSTTESLP